MKLTPARVAAVRLAAASDGRILAGALRTGTAVLNFDDCDRLHRAGLLQAPRNWWEFYLTEEGMAWALAL